MDPDRRDEIPIGPDLTALERRLSGWRPAPGALDRDRMLYDAGLAAAGAGGRPWRLASAALLLVSMGLGGALIHQRSVIDRERVLLAREHAKRIGLETQPPDRAEDAPAEPASQEAPEPPGPSSHLVLAARLAEGWDVVAPADAGTGPAPDRPAPGPSEGERDPGPLRQHDIPRALDF